MAIDAIHVAQALMQSSLITVGVLIFTSMVIMAIVQR
jgi:hypothetical protein